MTTDNAAKNWDLSYFSTDAIRPAFENHNLYDDFAPANDDDDYALYASIKESGIKEPLHISADGIILSGHRRHAAAQFLELDSVPCFVVDNVVYGDLSPDERIAILAIYNKQRNKSHSERLREAMAEINPDQAHERLREDRRRRHIDIAGDIDMGEVKKRARITTRKFLKAAQKAITSEKQYWPLSVRRVHYLLLNNPPLRHDKKPDSTYQNDKANYKALTNLLIRARLSGEVPMNAIEDETRPIRVVESYQDPALFVADSSKKFLKGYARDLLRGQKNHIEILVEKNAIRRHIEVVADEYCIPCTTGRGYSSLTPRWEMVRRFRRSGKDHLILLVLADFDPDGEMISQSFPRSLRDDFKLSNVTARKVALSGDDVHRYNLPSDLEAKTSSPNYKKFVARHGIHVAELDAAPVELLQTKLREAIEASLDMEIFNAELEAEKEDARFIEAVKKTAVDSIQRVGVEGGHA